MRKVLFANGEFYHIYNRGVDKRNIFTRSQDVERFLQCMVEFNRLDPIGSLYEQSFHNKNSEDNKRKNSPLIKLICYCLNPNHFHMILEQVSDRGIEKYMHRLGTGYTRHFNDINKRNGSLFQGPYKAVYINSNTYLLHLNAYISLNHRVHQLSGLAAKLVRSSWDEYIIMMNSLSEEKGICKKDIILSQFTGIAEYTDFAEASLKDIMARKELYREMEEFLLE